MTNGNSVRPSSPVKEAMQRVDAANRQPESINEALKKMDDDLRRFAPPAVRDIATRMMAEPAPGLIGASDSTEATIMGAIEECEKKVAALRENAEKGMKALREFTTNIAKQQAQLLEEMTELEGRLNESVERIVQIGRPVEAGGERE